MKRMATFLSRAALMAAMGASALAFMAPAAQARDRWRHDDRIVERCDPWGDHCRLYRCDWDGDDCYRVRGPYDGPRYHSYYEYDYYAPPPPRPGVSLGVRVR